MWYLPAAVESAVIPVIINPQAPKWSHVQPMEMLMTGPWSILNAVHWKWLNLRALPCHLRWESYGGGNSCTSTLKTMWPLLSGAWSDGGTYMHSTELSQFTLHDSSLTLFVDRVLKWTTKEPWFHFPPWTSTYSSPEAMKRIRPEEERQGGINAMF